MLNTNITYLKLWCQKILPLVYDDSLSYYEFLCKVTDTLNNVINNLNDIPDYIKKLIEEIITSGTIEDILSDLLSNFMLNVKYPPEGIKAATGDGSTDDTNAIQGCIDYAENNGYGAVYLPSGKYLTGTITLKNNVGIYGCDRYSTTLVCKSGSSNALLKGNVSNVTIANITLDCNAGNQVNNVDGINATISNMLLINICFIDTIRHAVLSGNGGHLQLDNVIFGKCSDGALSIDGDVSVQCDNMVFEDATSNYAIKISTNDGVYNFISTANVKTCLSVAGDNNTINASIVNATTTVDDTGNNNSIEIANDISKKTFKNIVTNITDTKTINAKNIEEYLSGNKISSSNSSTEITKNKNLNIESDYTETIGRTKRVNATDIIVSPTNNMKYSKNETIINKYFKGLPITDNEQNTYVLLPNTGDLVGDIEFNRNTNYFALLFTPYCEEANYYPQGSCLLDDDTVVVSYVKASDNTAILQKIKISTGEILLTSEKTTAYHCNSLSFDGVNTIYSANFYTNGSTGKSNVITKFNATTLSISETITIELLSSQGVRSACYNNGFLYIMDRNHPAGFWKYDITNNSISKLFTFMDGDYQLAFLDSGMNVWLLMRGGPCVYKYDITGALLKTIVLSSLSSDYMMINIESENLMEMSDGTIIITDVMYKYTINGVYCRHVLATLERQKQVKLAARYDARFGFNQSYYCSNTYNILQNGDANAPYDSLLYAGMVGSYLPNICTINLSGETYDQYIELDNGTYTLTNGTLQGIIADNCKLLTTNLTILSGAAQIISDDYSLNRLCCIFVNRYCNCKFSTNTIINGESKNNIVGVIINYNSEAVAIANSIKNTSLPILNRSGNRNVYYGAYLPDTSGACLSSGYRNNHMSNYTYRTVGGDYGQEKLVLRDLNMGNITTITFNSANYNSPMLELVIRDVSVVYDLEDNHSYTYTYVSTVAVSTILFTINKSIVNGKVTLTFSNIRGFSVSASGFVKTNLSDFPVTSAKLF